MYRGFSTIEILLAITLTTSTCVAVALVALGMPQALEHSRERYIGLQKLDAVLNKNALRARVDFSNVVSIATTTDGSYEISLQTFLFADEVTMRLTAYAHWKDVRGIPQDISLSTIVTDPNNAGEGNGCGVLAGDWRNPVVQKTYSVTPGGLLSFLASADQYPVSHVAKGREVTALAIEATTGATSPTLFLFKSTSIPYELIPYGLGFDNAPVSRFGFSQIVISKNQVYGANNFGSASLATCSTSHNCDQLQIFDTSDTTAPSYLSSLQLATMTPPYALSAGGVSAGAKSIAYKKGYVYLGLQKTVTGNEFNIIDVHDPQTPTWIGGARIGRTINNIVISGTRAYLATDDTARELIIFDIQDPHNPTLLGFWNAPGSIGFGYGTGVHVQNGMISFGRSYVSNAPELVILDGGSLPTITELGSKDLGTFLRPQSVHTLITRDFLTFILTDSILQVWNTSEPKSISLHGEVAPFRGGSTATSFTCKSNVLYVGGYEKTGNVGQLSIITDS